MRIWSGQIGLVREQLSAALLSLTQEFAGIVGEMDLLIEELWAFETDEVRLAGNAVESRMVKQLRESAVRIDSETGQIKNRVDRALVHLQFHDRVDQILAHVQQGIGVLDAAYAESGKAADFSAVLQTIRALSTTPEENGLHGQRKAAGCEGDADELTFF